MAGAMRVKSISSRKPVRSRCESMFATERQQAQDELLLAHLQAEDADASCPPVTAACSAMLSARLVLPTDGRAARMMRSLFWRPVVSVSRSAKPVRMPLISPLCSWR